MKQMNQLFIYFKKNITKNIKIIIIFIELIIIVLGSVVCHIYEPSYVIKDRIGIIIPVSSKIINYKYQPYDFFSFTDNVYTKIQLSKEDANYVIKQFKDDLNFTEYDENNENYLLLYFGNKYKWFSANKENSKVIYHSYRIDREFHDKSIHEVWGFICYEN